MDDFKIVIYIILAILYFIITNFKKFRQKAQPGNPETEHPELPPVSFEEILKQHRPKPETKNNSKRSESLRTAEFAGGKKYKTEQTEIKALSLENRADAAEAKRRSLERQERIRTAEQKQPPKVHPLAAQLQDPASARNAIILSEILKRKEY